MKAFRELEDVFSEMREELDGLKSEVRDLKERIASLEEDPVSRVQDPPARHVSSRTAPSPAPTSARAEEFSADDLFEPPKSSAPPASESDLGLSLDIFDGAPPSSASSPMEEEELPAPAKASTPPMDDELDSLLANFPTENEAPAPPRERPVASPSAAKTNSGFESDDGKFEIDLDRLDRELGEK